MISLLHLNKLLQSTIFLTILILNSVFADTPADIWKKKENKNEQNNQISNEEEITIESPILSGDINKISIEINEQKIILSDHHPIEAVFSW